jgi:mono/diheme cytochrome c family protein
MKNHRLISTATFALALTWMSFNTAAASANEGRAAYVDNGCWGCHGFEGQGGTTGPKLAPNPKPLEFFDTFIRHTQGKMPPYSEKVLPKAELVKIHDYLKSIPPTADYKTIPLLK